MSAPLISASLIIDDFPANASYWRRIQCEAFGYDAPQVCDFSRGWPEQRKAPFITPSTYEKLITLIEEHDVRGKLSVLPFPAGLGRLDQSVRYLPDADRERLLNLTRDRMASRFMICLEVLTHSMAFNPKTGALLPHTESAWISHLAAERRQRDLADIFSHGNAVLRDVGLQAQGFVLGGMPDVSNVAGGAMEAIRTEGAHLDVLAAALREAADRNEFKGPLGIMACSSHPAYGNNGEPFIIPHSQPQTSPVYHFYPTVGEPLLKCLQGCGNIDDEAGKLVSADLKHGALIDVAESGCPVNILVHAQTLNAMNTGQGVEVLSLALTRFHQRYGDRIRWQTPLEQAESRLATG